MIIKKIASAITISSLVLGTLAPSVFAETLTTSGNGSYSTNTTSVSTTNSSDVVQNNTATITNSITSTSQTGNNTANDNTGGNTFVTTGDATNHTLVSNQANLNQISNTMGSLTTPTTDSLISGNGSYSNNSVTANMSDTSSMFQNNNAVINNDINSHTSTGENQTDRNTGGTVRVLTGSAMSDVGISNSANANIVGPTSGVGGNTALTGGSGLTAEISGNGSRSLNDIEFNTSNDRTVVQNNYSTILNDVVNESRTGNNRLNDNTGGSVLLGTGNAHSRTLIDTMGGFNQATSTDSFLTDTMGTLFGNGSYSNNSILSTFGNNGSVFQNAGNTESESNPSFDVANYVNYDPVTGDNTQDRNTLSSGDASLTITGNAMSDTMVSTRGNMNVVGPMGSLQLPGGLNLNFAFDLGSLFSGF